MNFIIAEDYEDLSEKAAYFVAAQIKRKAESVLGLATGATPLGMYENLSDMTEGGMLSFAKVKTVNLDEYVGLSPDNPQSYHYYMEKNLFSHIDIDPQNTYLPDGMAKDLERAAANYDSLICALGGIDLQVLGLGRNGHIGFNEPARGFTRFTHAVELSQSTRKANAMYFNSEEDVPKRALTMGIVSIMRARQILVLAHGKQKAHAVKQAFFGSITPHLPASVLQLHPNVTLIADYDALRG